MAKIVITKNYTELSSIKNFDDRLEYLKLIGKVGEDTFGFDRIFNQRFYRSAEWRRLRHEIIVRDNGCDMGLEGFTIPGKIIIHHMNPITLADISDANPDILDPEFLVCVSHETHNYLHYGIAINRPKILLERTKNDTIPWKGGTL